MSVLIEEYYLSKQYDRIVHVAEKLYLKEIKWNEFSLYEFKFMLFALEKTYTDFSHQFYFALLNFYSTQSSEEDFFELFSLVETKTTLSCSHYFQASLYCYRNGQFADFKKYQNLCLNLLVEHKHYSLFDKITSSYQEIITDDLSVPLIRLQFFCWLNNCDSILNDLKQILSALAIFPLALRISKYQKIIEILESTEQRTLSLDLAIMRLVNIVHYYTGKLKKETLLEYVLLSQGEIEAMGLLYILADGLELKNKIASYLRKQAHAKQLLGQLLPEYLSQIFPTYQQHITEEIFETKFDLNAVVMGLDLRPKKANKNTTVSKAIRVDIYDDFSKEEIRRSFEGIEIRDRIVALIECEFYDLALELVPKEDGLDNLYLKQYLAFQKQDFLSAISIADEVIDAGASDVELLPFIYCQGQSYKKIGQIKFAKHCFSKILSIDPQYRNVYGELNS